MISLTVRDLPESDMNVIRLRAARNHRSLNSEIISILEYVSSFGAAYDFPARPAATSQQEKVLSLFGKWKDTRSEQQITNDIESSRTTGREVAL